MSSTAFIWSDFSFPSPVDDILKRPNFKLEDLLDEDDVVVDTRSQKEGLKEFLVQKETLVALIKYISEDAPSGASDTVKFRWALMKEVGGSSVREEGTCGCSGVLLIWRFNSRT
eukprot:TRINITY_DN2800_c0_g1_i7.p1 TRINITY_DN2800_c0_g1~~TRINITY_DN2800_c0_g1_i7.p1  ORF type:complete len:114 (-),score=15.71 TRINITY_DN2800_c0_g1_i7:389-730(-)